MIHCYEVERVDTRIVVVVAGMMAVVVVFDQMVDMPDGKYCYREGGYWSVWLIVESADRLCAVVLGEFAMTVDYWLFESFFDCWESCVVVEMVGLADCCNCGFGCFDLFVVAL